MTKTVLLHALLLFSFIFAGTSLAEDPEPSGDGRAKIDQALARSVVDRIAVDVERLRGLEFKEQVPVAVVNDDQAIAQHMKRMEEFDVLDDLAAAETVLKVLGLADPDDDVLALFTDALREQVGGYYDPSTDQFYLLDDMPAAMVDILTAHELTHALDDQYYPLDALLEVDDADDDEVFAHSAVTEGSATLLMTIYSVENAFDQSLTEEDLTAMTLGQEALDAMPEVLTRQLLAPYVLGMTFVQGGNPMAWAAGGFPVDDVNRAFANPPVSSEQILHPDKYWKDDQRDDPVAVVLGQAGASLGRGWTMEYDGVLGELTLALLVGGATPAPDDPSAIMGSAWTNRAATGWGGDRFELWTKGKKSVVLLSTVWDSKVDAEQFAGALEHRPMWTVRDGKAVALVYGDVPKKRGASVARAMLQESSAP